MRTTYRSWSIGAWSVVAAVVLAGCGGSTGSDGPTAAGSAESTSSTEATVVVAPATPRTITVDAIGIAHGTPDTMSLTLAVEVQGSSTTAVLDEVAAKSTALHDFLIAQGIPESQLQTTQLSVYPMYGGYSESGASTITGYSATVSTTVSVADLPGASSLVDGAAGVVGDALRVNGLMWSMSKTDELTATARTNAIDAARTQAAQLAAASDLTLGEIISVNESTNYGYGYGTGEGGSASIPFDPGTGTVQVFVTVTFQAS